MAIFTGFQSYQSGIEMSALWLDPGNKPTFQSYQSGIEIVVVIYGTNVRLLSIVPKWN